MTTAAPSPARLAERVRELQALFERIAATRMAGVALLHDGLQVQVIGFQPDRPGTVDTPAHGPTPIAQVRPYAATEAAGKASVTPSSRPPAPTEPPGGVGILITPWFMNLVWLPLDAAAPTVRVGDKRTRVVGNERFDFIGAFEPGFGGYEACSLFSPMFEFVDHGAAVATAFEVLKQLRAPKAESTNQASQTSEADNWASIMSPGESARETDDQAASPTKGAPPPTGAGRITPDANGSPVDLPESAAQRATSSASTTTEPAPSRRALLFGRTATGAPAP
jgi:[NiFe] hydrogenase assembly HybE family chaperone